MDVHAVIFDFDGPINDSFREGMRRIKVLCSLHNVPYGRQERLRLIELWGLPGIELLQQGLLISEDLAQTMYREWERIDLADPVPLVPGAKDVLYWLRRNGLKTALLTTRNRQNISEIFEELDMHRHFDVISCRQDVQYYKPDPRAFEYVQAYLSEQFNIGRDNCIFVGDTPTDIKAGSRAGYRTLVVQTGPYLLKHAAKYPIDLTDLLNSVDDLPLWLEENHDGEIEYLYD